MKNIKRLESLIEVKKKRVSALENNIKLQNAEIEKLNQKLEKLKGSDGGLT